MKLKVKSMDDRSHDFEIDDNSTVSALRRKVAELYEIPPSEMTLIYSGRVISNGDATLTSIGLAEECTLHMIKKLPRPPNDRTTRTTEPTSDRNTAPPNEPPNCNSINYSIDNSHSLDSPRVVNFELHASVASMTSIPDNITQYINRMNPLRARYQQRAQELRQRFPVSTTIPQDQRDEDLEFLFAKMSGATEDWNRFYTNYCHAAEREDLMDEEFGATTSTTTSDTQPIANERHHFYFQEYMRHLSETLTKVDRIGNIIRITIQELRSFAETAITSTNVEDVQSRVQSTMNNFCRLMAIFSIMLQQLASVQINIDTNAPFAFRTIPNSLTDTMRDTTLSQLLGTNLFTTNVPSADMTNGVAIPIITAIDSYDEPNTTNASQSNENRNYQQPNDNIIADDVARSIREMVAPFFDAIPANTTNPADMQRSSQQTRRGNNTSRNPPRSQPTTATTNPPPSPPMDENFLNNLASTDERYRSFLESEYRRIQRPETVAATQAPSSQRSFNYLRDVANDEREVERIEAAGEFFRGSGSDFILSSKPYRDHAAHLRVDSFRRRIFDKLISSPEFNQKYGEFIKGKLLHLQTLYRSNDS